MSRLNSLAAIDYRCVRRAGYRVLARLTCSIVIFTLPSVWACTAYQVQISNTSNPAAGTYFQVGDGFQVLVQPAQGCTGASLQVSESSSQNGAAFLAPGATGNTNASGVLMVTGTFSTAQIGTWKELWTVGSYQATPELTFQIGNSPATAPANMTTEFIYAGDRVLAEIHTPPAIFTDVPPTANYANDADVMAADGITTGCTATTYCPTANLLRSQMAIFIVRGVFAALNGAGNQDNFAYPTTPYFTDVPSGSYGFQWIQKLYEMGVTTGCSGTPGNLQFCPNNTTENYDTLIFTLRGRLCVSAAGANNCGSSAPIPYPSTPQYFTDINSSSPYFSYVQAAASQSIISTNNPGCTPVGNFCAFNPMKRSLMSMWIVRGVLSETSY